jgi:hypothetical protein
VYPPAVPADVPIRAGVQRVFYPVGEEARPDLRVREGRVADLPL